MPKPPLNGQLPLLPDGTPLAQAQAWLKTTWHPENCQCHRCFWAHGVIGGRITATFEAWRERR